jgi:flagellar basal body P-ring formation protein FlgA
MTIRLLPRLIMVSFGCAVLCGGSLARADDAVWTADHLRSLVRDYLAEAGHPVADTARIGPLDDRMKVASCEGHTRVEPRSAYSSSFVVACDGANAWSYTVRVDGVEPSKVIAPVGRAASGGPIQQWHVVVPRANLPAGTILTAAMIEERDVTQPPNGSFLKSADAVIGLRLTTALSTGMAITTMNVARAPTIMKGETIMLTAEGEGFSIATPAQAEEDGFEGDLVAVKNLRSGVVLSGRVAQAGIVIVR